MKMTTLWHRYAKVPWICLLPLSPALAFEDIYEPNDSFEQATDIFVDSNVRQQYTLHNLKDEDWFKFSASVAGNPYQIIAYNVGNNINVALEIYDSDGTTLLKSKEGCCKGEEKSFNWNASADGVYYLKVSDMITKSDDCRLKMQYELKILPNKLGVDDIPVKVLVTDVFSSEKRIHGANVSLCGKTTANDDNGKYSLQTSCPNSTVALTVEAVGYKPLTCHLPIFANVEVITKNIALIPIGQTVPIQPVSINPDEKLELPQAQETPSQKTLYHNGDTLHVKFPLPQLLENICVRYYLGIQYPDGRLFIIKRFNDMTLFNPNEPLSHWVGIGHENETGNAQVVIDMPVDNNFPRGDYKLYLLRMPGYVEDPIKDLHLGKLNDTNFKIE